MSHDVNLLRSRSIGLQTTTAIPDNSISDPHHVLKVVSQKMGSVPKSVYSEVSFSSTFIHIRVSFQGPNPWKLRCRIEVVCLVVVSPFFKGDVGRQRDDCVFVGQRAKYFQDAFGIPN